jgi:nicotinamide-nucleotide amidase
MNFVLRKGAAGMTGKQSVKVSTKASSPEAQTAGLSLWRRSWPALLLPAVLLRPAAAAESVSHSSPGPVRYAIVVTGGELLSGAYADGHTHFLTGTLRPLGLQCVGSMCVDDKPADLKRALRFAADQASLVIVTGGLGPTENDITRETLSEFTRIALREHTDVLQAMSRRFGVAADRLRPNLRRQTQVPIRGTYLKNPKGTAVGLVFEPAKAVIVALPGPPRELQAMVRDELVPYLNRRFGTRPPGCSLTLRFVGVGQSRIDQTLKDHVRLSPKITLSSQFRDGRVDFSFFLPGDAPQDRQRLDELKQELLKHLGDYVYAHDETSLEQRVLELLQSRNATLTLVEAGSGGSLAAGLGGAENVRHVLAGAYVAPTEEKLRRLLRVPDEQWSAAVSSTQRAQLLASAAADLTGSPWVVAVGEVEQNAGGARSVQVVFRLPDGRWESRRVGMGGDTESARSRLATQLFDQLRRELK